MQVRTFILSFLVGLSVWFVYTQQGFGETISLNAMNQIDTESEEIPDQAIRLRILAHSDDVKDQYLKRKVRDEMIKEIETWAHRPANIQEARKLIKQHLPTFQQIAEETIKQQGFSYPVQVDFGSVPFPTKLYGDQVYPAGNYEALRITIGDGKGDNWWCVLFPPLCFVDMSNGDAIPRPDPLPASMTTQNKIYASASKVVDTEVFPTEKEQSVEVRFLFLDKWLDWFR
ncbi:stage II sporulation protein R [Hazenella coriacea]|nr:stage II sporulation protein R [Hazenella coriacea]